MLALITRARRLLADCRGSYLIEYSSLVLLLAIAAIALFGRLPGAPAN
jgi:hypothetical protein